VSHLLRLALHLIVTVTLPVSLASGTARQGRDSPAAASSARLSRDVGQLIVGTYSGGTPSAAFVSAVRAGRIGGVILMGDNTAVGVARVRAAINVLQAAAKRGGNPGLLVMTDQEGGEVRRLPGAPVASAAALGAHPAAIAGQGRAAATLLRAAGVNIDLAPVADVASSGGFIADEHRSFSSNARRAAESACSFASGLLAGGVGDTLKHFPGLGDALTSTDLGPVSVPASARQLQTDTAAYRRCGSGRRSLVMISSASYPSVTGHLPAVLSPRTYDTLLPEDRVSAVTISDAMDTPAFGPWPHPALTAISAGLDLVLYANAPQDALDAQTILLTDAEHGRLRPAVLQRADGRVLALKRALGLRTG
jgi:beta-N-acetylhexosaminidase